MDSKEIYKSKLVSAEEAIGHINSGDKIVTSFGCCEPLGIERALAENYILPNYTVDYYNTRNQFCIVFYKI